MSKLTLFTHTHTLCASLSLYWLNAPWNFTHWQTSSNKRAKKEIGFCMGDKPTYSVKCIYTVNMWLNLVHICNSSRNTIMTNCYTTILLLFYNFWAFARCVHLFCFYWILIAILIKVIRLDELHWHATNCTAMCCVLCSAMRSRSFLLIVLKSHNHYVYTDVNPICGDICPLLVTAYGKYGCSFDSLTSSMNVHSDTRTNAHNISQ